MVMDKKGTGGNLYPVGYAGGIYQMYHTKKNHHMTTFYRHVSSITGAFFTPVMVPINYSNSFSLRDFHQS